MVQGTTRKELPDIKLTTPDHSTVFYLPVNPPNFYKASPSQNYQIVGNYGQRQRWDIWSNVIVLFLFPF